MKKIVFVFSILFTGTLFSQRDTVVVIHQFPNLKLRDTTDSALHVPAQVSFFYPMGTNGFQSPSIENNFSLNMLYGVNGGLDGAEIGGLVNVNSNDVNGFQVDGIANITNGASNGTIIGGIANITSDSTNGFFVAGISNIAGDSSQGFQIAGISNTVNGSFTGGQIAGIANTNNGRMDGFQISGITNLNNGDINGVQVSGIANIVNGKTTGSQIGFINATSNLDGVQLGFINFAGESENAIPIGFLSFVKNGYQALDFSAAESINGNIALKLGVEKFYNIFRFGMGSYKGNGFLSYGYGLGGMIPFNEKNKLALELSCNQIVRNFWNSWDLDLLNRFEITYQRFIGKHFSFFAGPALNVYVTSAMTDGEYGTIHVPYTFYSENWWNGNVSLWVGGTAGIALRF